jgi:DNA polymerase III subunit beta
MTGLTAALQTVSAVVDAKRNQPILGCVLLHKRGSHVKLTAADSAIQVSKELDADMRGGDVYVAVPARKLLDVLQVLDTQYLSMDERQGKLRVRGTNSRFTMQTMPAADFPLASTNIQFCAVISVELNSLRGLLDRVSFAMAIAGDMRTQLSGVRLRVEGKRMQLAACDGHRIALADAEICTEVPRQEVILPRRTVELLLRLLRADKGDGGHVQLGFAAAQAEFKFNGTRVLSQLLDGRFPELSSYVPADHPVSLTVDRHLLAACLRRSAVMSTAANARTMLSLDNGLLSMCSSGDGADEAAAELPVDYYGRPVRIGINPRYLLEALSVLTQDSVQLELKDERSPVLMRALKDDGFTHVLMPMRI